MLDINGCLLNATVMQILTELKSQLKISGFNYLSVIRDSGDNIMVTCPFHGDGQERKPSCGVHKVTGVFHCFACGYTATLTEAISNLFSKNDGGLFGYEWLRKNFNTVEVNTRGAIEIDLSRNELKKENFTYVPEMVLDQYRYTHPYMYKRRMTDDIIELFDLGYDKETDCITFPVRDEKGNCLFVARRSVTGKYFNYPSGAHKPLYGLYELYSTTHYSVDDLWVTESMFNCLTLWTYGIPAIALNGTGSKEQIQALCDLPIRSIVLALDPDNAGRNGTNKIASQLKSKKIVRQLSYNENDDRDINDLPFDDFTALPIVFV